MNKSHVIEVSGVFLGAALRVTDGFRFVAVDPRVSGLHGQLTATLEEARRLASVKYHLARSPEPAPPPVTAPQKAACPD